MATVNITEEAVYDSGVKEIQVGEPVGGGPTAPANVQAKNLANRTKYLRQEQDSLKTKVDTLETKIGTHSLADALMKAQNLSDVPDKAAARQNLGVPATEHSHAAYVTKSANLSDIDNAATARDNIGALAAAEKGAVNGLASLDASGKLLESQRPDTLWETIANVTRSSNTVIVIPGDVRTSYPKGKRLRFNGSDTYLCRVYGDPTYSSGATTITVWFDVRTASIPTTITRLERSRLTPQDTANGAPMHGTDSTVIQTTLMASYCCGCYITD